MEQSLTLIASGLNETGILLEKAFEEAGGEANFDVILASPDGNISVNIDRSPGGSEEGGFELTIIKADLGEAAFVFAVQPRDVLASLGEIFGTEDYHASFPALGDDLSIRTSDLGRFQQIMPEQWLLALRELSGFSFELKKEDGGRVLEFHLQHAVRDWVELNAYFSMFITVFHNLTY